MRATIIRSRLYMICGCAMLIINSHFTGWSAILYACAGIGFVLRGILIGNSRWDAKIDAKGEAVAVYRPATIKEMLTGQ